MTSQPPPQYPYQQAPGGSNNGFGDPTQAQGGRPMPPSGPVALSPEERRVLDVCRSESFWYRSLPIGTVLATTAHILVQQGMLKPSTRYGSRPKAFLGLLLGYFFGKFSYATICEDKFLTDAPDSKIAAMVRARRGLPPREGDSSTVGSDDNDPTGSLAGFPPNTAGQLDQSNPPTVTPITSASGNTYDELRRRNREQASSPNRSGGEGVQPAFPPIPPAEPIPAPAPPQSRPSLYVPPPRSSGAKTKYGDEGFE